MKALRNVLPLRQCCVGLNESLPTLCLILQSPPALLLLFHASVTHIPKTKQMQHTTTDLLSNSQTNCKLPTVKNHRLLQWHKLRKHAQIHTQAQYLNESYSYIYECKCWAVWIFVGVWFKCENLMHEIKWSSKLFKVPQFRIYKYENS